MFLGLSAVWKVALCHKDGLAPINFDAVPHHILTRMYDAMRESSIHKHTDTARRMVVAPSRPRFRTSLPSPSFVREVSAINMRLAKGTEEDLMLGHKLLEHALFIGEAT